MSLFNDYIGLSLAPSPLSGCDLNSFTTVECLNFYYDYYWTLRRDDHIFTRLSEVLNIKFSSTGDEDLQNYLVEAIYRRKWSIVKVLLNHHVRIKEPQYYKKKYGDMLRDAIYAPSTKYDLMILLYLLPDARWDFYEISKNKAFFPNLIDTFDIDTSVVVENLNFEELSANPNLTIPFVEEHINEKWDQYRLSLNEAFTIEDIKNNPSLPFYPGVKEARSNEIERDPETETLLKTPLSDVGRIIDKCVSEEKERKSWEVVARRDDLDERFILSHTRKWEEYGLWGVLSANEDIPFWLIKNTFSHPGMKWKVVYLAERFDVDYKWLLEELLLLIGESSEDDKWNNELFQEVIPEMVMNPAVPIKFIVENKLNRDGEYDIYSNPNFNVAHFLLHISTIADTDDLAQRFSDSRFGAHSYFAEQEELRVEQQARKRMAVEFTSNDALLPKELGKMIGEFVARNTV